MWDSSPSSKTPGIGWISWSLVWRESDLIFFRAKVQTNVGHASSDAVRVCLADT